MVLLLLLSVFVVQQSMSQDASVIGDVRPPEEVTLDEARREREMPDHEHTEDEFTFGWPQIHAQEEVDEPPELMAGHDALVMAVRELEEAARRVRENPKDGMALRELHGLYDRVMDVSRSHIESMGAMRRKNRRPPDQSPPAVPSPEHDHTQHSEHSEGIVRSKRNGASDSTNEGAGTNQSLPEKTSTSWGRWWPLALFLAGGACASILILLPRRRRGARDIAVLQPQDAPVKSPMLVGAGCTRGSEADTATAAVGQSSGDLASQMMPPPMQPLFRPPESSRPRSMASSLTKEIPLRQRASSIKSIDSGSTGTKQSTPPNHMVVRRRDSDVESMTDLIGGAHLRDSLDSRSSSMSDLCDDSDCGGRVLERLPTAGPPAPPLRRESVSKRSQVGRPPTSPLAITALRHVLTRSSTTSSTPTTGDGGERHISGPPGQTEPIPTRRRRLMSNDSIARSADLDSIGSFGGGSVDSQHH